MSSFYTHFTKKAMNDEKLFEQYCCMNNTVILLCNYNFPYSAQLKRTAQGQLYLLPYCLEAQTSSRQFGA
jgi:hypothetical protein